jgi:integrase
LWCHPVLDYLEVLPCFITLEKGGDMFINILDTVPVRLGRAIDLSSSNSRLELDGNHAIVNIPIIIGDFDSNLRNLINHYILSKASSGKKDLSSTAKAFQLWVRWLIDHDINPLIMPKSKIDSPTYGFRHYLTERIVEHRNLSSSTANSYILVIKNFYDMLDNEDIVDKSVYYKSKVSIVDGYRKVLSSDLAIRVEKKRDDALTPLNTQTQLKLRKLLVTLDSHFALLLNLMIHSGLRLNEVLSLPESLFSEDFIPNDPSQKLINGLMIGPATGVKTKLSITRELFITSSMLELVIDYKFSNQYLIKKAKLKNSLFYNEINSPLFLTINGKIFSKSAFYSSWSRMKASYFDRYGEIFSHKPHDLRATFATNLIKYAMQVEPNNQQACIDITRYYMGHKNERTTLKYIKFEHRKEMADKVANIMDLFVLEALEGTT